MLDLCGTEHCAGVIEDTWETMIQAEVGASHPLRAPWLPGVPSVLLPIRLMMSLPVGLPYPLNCKP